MKTDQLYKIMQDIYEAAQKEREETSRTISEMIEKAGSSVPFVVQMLRRRPDVCIPTLIKSEALYKNEEPLDQKTSELIAISSAVANRAVYCMNVHMERALCLGATEQEILHTILISSAICETSAWAIAFREFEKFEGKGKSKKT
ncbi:MAG: hypothetical protein DRG87_06855 [Deltaproteobacteria bacterium]|nr:MAG: hypothetical protein DRG87_06855 [Deltaproteobacteria bacterium]